MSDLIISADESTYHDMVVRSELPVLIDFWAPWCGPCMALLPALEAIAKMYEGDLKVVKINADENPALMETFGVRGIPQLFFIRNGETVAAVKERTRTRLASEIEALLV